MAPSTNLPQPRNPSSRRSKRRKISYRELTSDEDLTDDNRIQTSTRKPVRSSTRVNNQRRTYNEDSSSSEGITTEPDSTVGPDPQLRHGIYSRQNLVTPTRRSTRKRHASSQLSHRPRSTLEGFRKAKMKNGLPKTNIDHSTSDTPIKNLRIPPWQDLEYRLLVEIFIFAAYPLYDYPSHPRPAIRWLLEISRLSKSFRSSAMAALLYSPPIYPAQKAHGLLNLLIQDQATLSTNYRTKIRQLHVEAGHLLMKKSGIPLEEIVSRTPLLSTLCIYHNHDRIGPVKWARPTESKKNWTYPESLFETLDQSKISLKEFTWNGRFPGTKQVFFLSQIHHPRPCFNYLRSLSFMNMTVPEKLPPEKQMEEYEDVLLDALEILSSLRELTFQNCNILNARVMADRRFPHNLREISLIDCGKLTSQGLQVYLQASGTQVEHLVLEGNQDMDLGFISNLADLCPQLQTLRIDCTYTDYSAYHNTEPHFERLLPSGQPTWPKSLREINLANIRNINASEADEFFKSLLMAAPDLPNLRHLSLRANLKVGWRDRANLRSKWKSILERVFLRKSRPPNSTSNKVRATNKVTTSPSSATATTLSRLPTNNSLNTIGDPSSANPDDKSSNNRKSVRIARKELEADTISTEEDQSSAVSEHMPGSTTTADVQADHLFIQGLCDIVIFRIDGQRPADDQFNEGDFLDDEPSGDEDWNGRDPETYNRHAW